MSDRFVDVEQLHGDFEAYLRSGIGSTSITRALGKEGPTKADGEIGNATHIAVLQPHLLEERVVVPPKEVQPGSGDGQRARKVKWLADEAKGKIVVTQAEYSRVLAMRDELERRKTLAWLRDSGVEFERAFRATDAITGLTIRVRPDAERGVSLFDLKTAKSPDFDSFQRAVHSNMYAVQAALYLDVLARGAFWWVVVGKEWPHRCGLYRCPDTWIELGRRAYRAGLTILANTDEHERPRAWWEDRPYELQPPPWWAEQEIEEHEKYAARLLDEAAAEHCDGGEDDDERETSDEPIGWAAEEAP